MPDNNTDKFEEITNMLKEFEDKLTEFIIQNE